jgi:hypothetical protein
MSVAALIRAFEIASIIGSVLVAAKLLITGLCRKYPVFFCFFLFQIPVNVLPYLVKNTSDQYAYFWVCQEPIQLIFYILVVRELFWLILRKHPGLLSLGRWAMYVAVAASVTISFLSLLPKITPAMPQRTKLLGYAFAAQRGVDLSLILFIVLMMLFISRYPIPLSRNVLVHASIYSVYFISCTFVLVLRAVFGIKSHEWLDLAITASTSACVFAWLFFLNPKGEEIGETLPAFSSEQEHRLLEHLDSLNATLLRVSGK